SLDLAGPVETPGPLARWRRGAMLLGHRRRRRDFARSRGRRPPHHQLRPPDLASPPGPGDAGRADLSGPFDRGRIALPPGVMAAGTPDFPRPGPVNAGFRRFRKILVRIAAATLIGVPFAAIAQAPQKPRDTYSQDDLKRVE